MTFCGFLSFFPLSFAALSDIKRRIIPDWTVFLLFSFAALNIALGYAPLAASLLGMVGIGLPLWISAARWDEMGGGDVKLCAALGLLLGFERMLSVLIVALVCLVLCGKIQRKNSLPFAPFLWGAFYMLLVSENLKGS